MILRSIGHHPLRVLSVTSESPVPVTPHAATLVLSASAWAVLISIRSLWDALTAVTMALLFAREGGCDDGSQECLLHGSKRPRQVPAAARLRVQFRDWTTFRQLVVIRETDS